MNKVRAAMRAAACLVLLLGARRLAPAQSNWEFEPYRVRFVLAFQPNMELSPLVQADFSAALLNQSAAVYGAMWDARVAAADRATLVDDSLREGTGPAYDDLPAEWVADADKLIVVRVAAEPASFRVSTREFDVVTRAWSTPQATLVPQRGALAAEAFRVVMAGHAPLARVESVEGKQAVLRLKAAALPSRDPDVRPALRTTVFQPYLRFNDRKGEPKRIDRIEWTLLYPTADMVSGPELPCQVITGLRSPLSARRRGRTQQLALAVVPPRGGTRLVLASRSDPNRKLMGYEVFAHPADSTATVLLGRTAGDGSLMVASSLDGQSAMRVLLVRNGGDILARLPLVPGVDRSVQAVLPDDSERLDVEGFITGLQEELVDTVAQRELLLARIRARLKESRPAEAQELLAELRTLRTRDRFNAILTERRKTVITSDPLVRKQVERLFIDTEKVIAGFLDPKPLQEIEAEVAAAAGSG
jgi:hypothetical protein